VQEERNIFVRAELLLDHMHRRSDDDFARFRVALRNLRQEHILQFPKQRLSQSVPEPESASVGESAAAATVRPSEVESLQMVKEITPVNEQMEVEQPCNDEERLSEYTNYRVELRHLHVCATVDFLLCVSLDSVCYL